jgi:hypothetical protein
VMLSVTLTKGTRQTVARVLELSAHGLRLSSTIEFSVSERVSATRERCHLVRSGCLATRLASGRGARQGGRRARVPPLPEAEASLPLMAPSRLEAAAPEHRKQLVSGEETRARSASCDPQTSAFLATANIRRMSGSDLISSRLMAPGGLS